MQLFMITLSPMRGKINLYTRSPTSGDGLGGKVRPVVAIYHHVNV